MTDRSLAGYGYGQTLRYTRRSSVYSRRSGGMAAKDVQTAAVVASSPVAKTALQPVRQQSTAPKHRSYPPSVGVVMQDVVVPVRRAPAQPQEAPLASRVQSVPQGEVPFVESKSAWRQRLFTKNNLLVGMAAFVFLSGVGVSLQSVLTNKHITKQVQAQSQGAATTSEGTSGDDKPDETHVDAGAVGSYHVAPDLPRKITIPKINVSARVKPLGVNRDNQLLAPANIYDGGWYNASAKPGVDAGAVLIDGHVHGPTKPGVFYNLTKLTVGDMIEVERGDGRVVKYRVEKTQQANTGSVDMAALMTSVRPGVQGLNLITCGGRLDKKTGHYEGRDMVFAVQVE